MSEQQRTPEWFAARCGKVTASKISEMMAKTKSGEYGEGRINYKVALAWEHVLKTPQQNDGFISQAMQDGIDAEPDAKKEYAAMCDTRVIDCGFIPHPTIADSGASPDGFVGDDGLIEVKCPILKTHSLNLLGDPLPRVYRLQQQWQLACTGRLWVDNFSYLDKKRYPDDGYDRRGVRGFIRRMWRDDKLIAEIEREVILFLSEVRAMAANFEQRFPDSEARATAAIDIPITGAG